MERPKIDDYRIHEINNLEIGPPTVELFMSYVESQMTRWEQYLRDLEKWYDKEESARQKRLVPVSFIGKYV